MTCRSIVTKAPQHPAGHHSGSMFVDAPRCHASMRRLDDDGDSLREQHLLDDVRYLSRETFLYLQPAGKRVDDTRQL
jgi:hypothetical protein